MLDPFFLSWLDNCIAKKRLSVVGPEYPKTSPVGRGETGENKEKQTAKMHCFNGRGSEMPQQILLCAFNVQRTEDPCACAYMKLPVT